MLRQYCHEVQRIEFGPIHTGQVESRPFACRTVTFTYAKGEATSIDLFSDAPENLAVLSDEFQEAASRA